MKQPLIVRRLGCVDYKFVEQEMKDFTRKRTADTQDEVWLLEHFPVYTMGVREVGGPDYDTFPIPFVKTNRGGEMTYHGPGQLVAYFLLDFHRRRLGLRFLVKHLEALTIDFLASYGVASSRKKRSPGVYIDGKKIASLGLHASTRYCYHGISINIDMDLRPFDRIDVCGLPSLEMTQLSEKVDKVNITEALDKLEESILKRLASNQS